MSDTPMLYVGTNASQLIPIQPDPATLSWGLQDISSSDSGRTHDANTTMQKMRISQKRKLNITWTMLTDSQISVILKAFNPEYFYVRYWDAQDCEYQIRLFYAGDRTAPVKWFKLPIKGTRFATLSLNIIER